MILTIRFQHFQLCTKRIQWYNGSNLLIKDLKEYYFSVPLSSRIH